jgi:hypothetical protein
VTWPPLSAHRAWCPPPVHRNTGGLGSAGSRLPGRSPTSPLLCRPPTPCPHRPRLRFPWPWPPARRTLVLCLVRPTTRVPADVPCGGDGSPALRQTGVCRGEARASQGTGPSSACVRWSKPPRRRRPPSRPLSARGRCCLRCNPALAASGKSRGFGAAVPRPARSPASASPHVFPRTAQGVRPARAGAPLAGRDVHPLDDARSFLVASHPPIPFDPQGLVALKILSAF